ncbi:MAG: hypothetical protein KKG00_14235 [Bacteroidetes bacterium]|nr:hypothetical protein [Bacteroidota bacterium]
MGFLLEKWRNRGLESTKVGVGNPWVLNRATGGYNKITSFPDARHVFRLRDPVVLG